MMLAAPEFVIAERIELLDQVEVAPELQHRMLADRMMRGEEGSKLQARHVFPHHVVILLREPLLGHPRGRFNRDPASCVACTCGVVRRTEFSKLPPPCA